MRLHANCHSDNDSKFGETPCSVLNSSEMALLDNCYQMRFVLGLPTTQLLSSLRNNKERLALSIVALLDLDRQTLQMLIPREQWQFVDNCHHYLRQQRKKVHSSRDRCY